MYSKRQERKRKQRFNSNHSELETNPEKSQRYAELLATELGHGFTVDGIIEMGSYSKGEAVPGSDIDTRVYVSSPNYYLWQTSSGRFRDSQQEQTEQKFKVFLQTAGEKPRLTIDWYSFNQPAAQKLGEMLGVNVEFGLADSRFADYELQQMSQQPTLEHHLLLQGNVLYNPNGFLTTRRAKIEGIIYPALADFYQKRCLDGLPFEIYTHLEPHEMDLWKIEKSRQIQWVKWAVRAIRDAVAAKTYIQHGKFLFKKNDVINFCESHLPPDDVSLIKELYCWKTNPQTRELMIENFLKNPEKFFALFKEYTNRLEDIVNKINKL